MLRTISMERIFPLGQYKNLKWREEITFDDEGMEKAQVDVLRHGLILNGYLGLALHNALDDELKRVAESEGNVLTPEDMVRLVLKERGLLEGEGSKVMKIYLFNEEVTEEDERISEED